MLDKISIWMRKSHLVHFYGQFGIKNNFRFALLEKAIGISNAYLSQIESSKIKQPSPNILHKICELYEIPYSDALHLAGYPVPTEETETEQHIALSPTIGPITEEEGEALIEYLAFLRSRHSRKGE